MNKDFVNWFCETFKEDFPCDVEYQRDRLLKYGESGLDSSFYCGDMYKTFEGAWKTWQHLSKQA